MSSMLTHQDIELRQLAPQDGQLLIDLDKAGCNIGLIGLPESLQECHVMFQSLESQMWSTPMTALSAGTPFGAFWTALPNVSNLNALVVTLFEDLDRGGVALALYIRHLFWSFPLHRLYTHVGALDRGSGYSAIYEGIGFKREGILKEHALLAGRRQDIVVYGLLREEFDRCMLAFDPALSLAGVDASGRR